MATIERMPKFGLSMEEGILSEWLVPIGGVVTRGTAIAVIEAEKLTNDAVASIDGVMLKYCLSPGDTATCGEPLCIIGEVGENPDADADSPTRVSGVNDLVVNSTPGDVQTVEQDAVQPHMQPKVAVTNAALTPRARLVAEKLRLSCSPIQGTGLLGMITVADIKAHGKPASEPRLIPMTGIQRTTAAAMKSSLENSAQTTVCIESGFAPLVKAYQSLKPVYAANGMKLSYTAMILYAVSRALADREDIRMQYYDEKSFLLPDEIHIGVAIDTERGLVVPVIRHADQKSLETICADLSDVSARARSGKLTQNDMGSAVTTVSNLAMAGATSFTPILNPPQSTILGVCKLRDIPVVRDGGIFVEPTMNLCLTYDHRVLNGAPACRYLQTIIDILNGNDWR